MCGMGRTGTLFACEQEGVVPDIVCVAKGLGAGYLPIGAAICSQAIYDAVAAGSGALAHGHTYMGHPVACAAALAVQRAVQGRGLLPRVRALGDGLGQRLRAAFGDHPHVGDIRGRGLFWALELVADRQSKAPFDPARRTYARVKVAALEAGLLCYPMGGTVDGVTGDHIILAPPYTLAEEQLDEIVVMLTSALAVAVAQ
jgi:adenosylmethionine-8-amino-7-oxononanoate aminotransferase